MMIKALVSRIHKINTKKQNFNTYKLRKNLFLNPNSPFYSNLIVKIIVPLLVESFFYEIIAIKMPTYYEDL
jgi:hypothetical protein